MFLNLTKLHVHPCHYGAVVRYGAAMAGVRSVNPCAPVANGRASCARHRQPGGTAHGALARKTAHVQAGHKRLHTPTDACLHSMASSERVHTEGQQAERVRHARLWSADRGSRSIESVFCKGCVVAGGRRLT